MPLERYKALGLNEDSEFDNQPCNSLDEVIKASKAISHRNQVVLVVDMREKCFAVTAGDSDLLDTPNNIHHEIALNYNIEVKNVINHALYSNLNVEGLVYSFTNDFIEYLKIKKFDFNIFYFCY